MRFRVALIKAGLVGAFLILGSCAQRERATPEVRAVQEALVAKFPGTVVGAKLENETHLNISFINSELKKLPVAEKRAKAEEIARIAFASYADRAGIKSVRVAFVVLSAFIVVVTTNDSSDAFTFDAAELGDGSTP